MINSIVTTNFKALQSKDVGFENGLNILKGPNGVGKSSLMQALKFALYGTASVPGKKGSIPTWGKKKASVTLELDDGHSIERSTSDCKVKLDGEVVATGNAPCSSYISKLLQLDLKGFEMFHFSNQGETAALLTLGATELQRRVESHAGVEVIDGTIARARKGASRLAVLLEDIEEVSEEELKLARAAVESATNNLIVDQEAVTTAQNLVESAKLQRSKANEALLEARENNLRAEQYEKKKTSKESELGSNNKEIEFVKEELGLLAEAVDVETLEQLLDTKNKQLREAKEFNETRDEAISEVVAARDILSSEDIVTAVVAEWEGGRKVLGEHISTAEEEAETARDRLDYTQDIRTKAVDEERRAKAVVDSGACSECGRDFEDYDADAAGEAVAAAESEADDSRVEVDKAAEVLRSKTAEVKELHNKLSTHKLDRPTVPDWDELRATLERLAPIVDSERKRVEELRSEKVSISDSLAVAMADNSKRTRLERKVKQLGEISEELEETLKTMKVYATIVVEPLEAEVATTIDTFVEVNRAVNEAMNTLTTAKGTLKLAKGGLDTMEKDAATVKQYAKEMHLTNKLVDYLVKSRERFMGEVWDTILGNATHFCSTATAGWTSPSGRSKKLGGISRKDGEFFFSEDGIVQPISSASGAQRAFLGVGVRLGMSIALKGSHSLLVLDEPTSDMGNENANALAGALLGLPGQVIMITHRSYEELSANNVIDLGV